MAICSICRFETGLDDVEGRGVFRSCVWLRRYAPAAASHIEHGGRT